MLPGGLLYGRCLPEPRGAHHPTFPLVPAAPPLPGARDQCGGGGGGSYITAATCPGAPHRKHTALACPCPPNPLHQAHQFQARPRELPRPTARGHRETPGKVHAGRHARRCGTPCSVLLGSLFMGTSPWPGSHYTDTSQPPCKVGIITTALRKGNPRPGEGTEAILPSPR